MAKNTLKFIQLSDLHLFADPMQSLLGVNTHDSLQAVLARLRQEEEVDFIILSGDLSQDRSKASYQQVKASLSELGLPVYWLPGNHDDVAIMSHVLADALFKNDKQIVLPHWQLILLDSQIPGEVPGHLSDTALQYFEQCLQTHPDHHALVMFHHQPVPVGSQWLDVLGLTNADKFWQMATRYPRLSLVLFGHVHQAYQQAKAHITCYAPPSTCIQFKPHSAEFALDPNPPGYRVMVLHANGQHDTHVQRIDHYVGEFLADAKGY